MLDELRTLAHASGVELTTAIQPIDQDNFDRQCAKIARIGTSGGAIGAVLTPSGRVVLSRRTGIHPGYGLVGGSVDPGEDFTTAFAREVMEELGVAVTHIRLCIAENKRFVSPTGQGLDFQLAVFSARMASETLPPETAEARREGLSFEIFDAGNLPADMILADRAKLALILEAPPGL